MTKSLSWIAAGVALAALIGCQPEKPVVSLEQAKQITATFEAQGFKPPPRTIADITAILDQQKPDPAKADAARQAADAQPPAGADSRTLANVYFQRGLAAGELGRAAQAVDDLKEAVRLGREAKVAPQQFMTYLQRYGFAEQGAGNMKTAREVHLERLQMVNGGQAAPGWGFNVYQNLGILAARLGNLEEAQSIQTRMDRLLADSAGWRNMAAWSRTNNQAQVLRTRGAIAEASGRYAEAERLYREALALNAQLIPQEPEIYRLSGTPLGTFTNVEDLIHGDIARTLTRQGRLVEAESEARRTLLSRLQRRGRYAPETASDIVLLASIIFEQGRTAEAEKLARAAVDIYQSLGHDLQASLSLRLARAWVARTQAAQEQWQQAYESYSELRRGIEADPERLERFLATDATYPTVLVRVGQAAAAVPLLEKAVERVSRNLGERHYNTAELRSALAAALAKAGQKDRAEREFAAAMPILLSSSRQADDDEGGGGAARERRLTRAIEDYMAVLADARGSAAAEETFRLADAARGQSVQRALAASSARAAAADPALADLVRREQDAQKQTAALQGLLANMLSSPINQQDADGLRSVRTQIDTLRTARAAIREEIEKRFPDYVNLIDPRPATVAQARKDLRPGEALIATYVGTERTFVWAVPAQGPVAFATTPAGRTDIGRLVADLRKALDPNAATLGDIPAFDVALANKLYAALLQPVEAGWKQAKSLLVVPHGPLGQLPFAVLVTAPAPLPPDRDGQAIFANYKSVPFLAKSAAITQLPSVASLASLRALPAPRGDRQPFIGFGDPWFSPEQAAEAAREQQVGQLQTRGARTLVAMRGVKLVRRNAPATQSVDSAELAQLPRLPDTADEVRSIALALNADPAKDVFTGRDANERRVRSMDIANRKVVMFATHGLVPGDLNGLTQPALALSAPNVADVDGDGLLTLDEVLALKLNADWVVLSACNTATGDGAGAEAVSGLGRAFFYAGTRALLVSNWPVETNSARELTTDLFRRQAQNPGLSRAEAMRQAMVGLIDGPGYVDPESKQPVFSYAHPIFWAPFSLVGDGGGGQAGS
jgi:CHAT domain-containing protein